MITRIKSGNKIFALLVDFKNLDEGPLPITSPSCSLQMLMMKRKREYVVKKHMHKKLPKYSKQPQEAVVVVKGELKAIIFDRKGNILAKKKVSEGQCLFMMDGGLEVKITKNALAYEFKNGPYVEDKIPL